MKRKVILGAAAAVTMAGIILPAYGALELVIKNTDAVPGMPGASWANSYCFQSPSIDASGKVGFRGSMAANPDLGIEEWVNNETMSYGVRGSLNLVARMGSQAPGLPPGNDVTNFQSQTLPLSPSGSMWFGGNTTDPNGYVATGQFGGLSKVARNDDTLPGVTSALGGNPASSSNYSNLNNNSQTLVFGDLPTSGTAGLWVGNSVQQKLVYETGNAYSGLPGVVRSPMGYYMLNGSGNVMSGIGLVQNGFTVNVLNNEVIATKPYGSSSFTVLAREGATAPGAGGATYASAETDFFGGDLSAFFFTDGAFNNANHAIFSAGLEGTGVIAGSNDAALFFHNGSAAQIVHRRGDATAAVPGAVLAFDAGVSYTARMNNNDRIAWTTTLAEGPGGVTADNDTLLLQTQAATGADTLIAREGSAVPVLPGALWGSYFGSVMQNNAGQIVFETTLIDDPNDPNGDITATNDQALFAWDPGAGISMIAREGDDLSSLGINMVLNDYCFQLYSNANAEGCANAFMDNGWLTFRVTGTPISGGPEDSIAILRTVVPEPGSATLLIAGGLLSIRRGRRG